MNFKGGEGVGFGSGGGTLKEGRGLGLGWGMYCKGGRVWFESGGRSSVKRGG